MTIEQTNASHERSKGVALLTALGAFAFSSSPENFAAATICLVPVSITAQTVGSAAYHGTARLLKGRSLVGAFGIVAGTAVAVAGVAASATVGFSDGGAIAGGAITTGVTIATLSNLPKRQTVPAQKTNDLKL